MLQKSMLLVLLYTVNIKQNLSIFRLFFIKALPNKTIKNNLNGFNG